jgi:hypothetical protein
VKIELKLARAPAVAINKEVDGESDSFRIGTAAILDDAAASDEHARFGEYGTSSQT